ncbi:MAG: CBS domain-containing protein [Candidatus Rokubacteria bacterium]|nr:CBS domain-containing protein [Candidatus Rokubacteria bacterium]
MKVKEVMTRDPVTVDPEAPLGTAMDVMRRKRIRHLPVVDDAGRLLGIITDRDLRQATFAPALAEHLSLGAQRRLRGIGQALEDLRVKHAMTWVVVTTDPEATIARAAVVMFERRIGSLPVVEDGKLVGILTERDLLLALAREFPDTGVDQQGFLW